MKQISTKSNREFNYFELSNGIRVVHKEVSHTKVSHCGFILDIGSRDEEDWEQGIAHFWEHMAFKGTKKRKAFHILNRLESVGGELNAYTTKEKICFYASVLDQYFEQALELLADITFDSVFPEKQIEKERNVILEEMAMYYDVPEDAIQDDFDQVVFGDHPLGKNILGSHESVRAFRRDDFRSFIQRNLSTDRLVFSCVGNVSFSKVKRLAEKYLSDLPAQQSSKKRKPFSGYEAKSVFVDRELTQAHCGIGRTAYPVNHPDRLKFFMLNNILGGPGMNSRLNLALREKHGYVYSIDSSYQSYIDTGLVGIFFGTEPRQIERSIQLVMKELRRLREKPLGIKQLHSAKAQLMGQLAMADENNANLMLMMGKSLLDQNEIESLESIFKELDSIGALELQDIANNIFDEESLSFLVFRPAL